MSIYDKIYETAIDFYGLITADEAKNIGIPNIELVKLAHRGKLIRLGHGLYRLSRYIPTLFDAYAEAVKMVGPEAFLYGESVLALHSLVPINPSKIYVASSLRIRKRLPEHICMIKANTPDDIVYYEGIPSQNAVNAIRACFGSIMNERIIDAIHESRRIGIITVGEVKMLMKELKNGREAPKQQEES